MGNGSRYIHTHYAIAFISDKMHHKTLTHPLPQSLVHIINDDIQRKNAMLSARAVACPHNHWQEHSFSSPEPRILWLRVARGSGKLYRLKPKFFIWTSRRMLLEETGSQKIASSFSWISLSLKLVKTAISSWKQSKSQVLKLSFVKKRMC